MALTGEEKVTILLNMLGADIAADVIRSLSPQQIEKITTLMTKKKTVSQAVIEQVIKETSEIISRGDVRMGGEEYIKKVLAKGLGEDGAQKVLDVASKEGPLDTLRWIDPKTLVNFLTTEHPQTAALIVCLLEPPQAAEVLAALPETLKEEVALRIATIDRIPEHAIEEIREVLRGQMEAGAAKGKKLGGIKTVADILNQCDRSTEEHILTKIEEQNGPLADSIRQLMFVFDDLVKIDDRGIQMILKEAGSEDLSVALKTASDALKEKIFKNMSSRASQILKEDIQTRGPVKVSDVDKAQQSIVKVARRLETEGKIILGERGGEELVA